MNLTKLENIEFDGIDYNDHPDYCDAYISNAQINGVHLTQEELDEVNEDRDFVYEELMDYLN